LQNPKDWKHLYNWKRSLKKGSNPFADELPWMTYRAIDYIKDNLSDDSVVFEFGSGGSTLFFSKHYKKVVSVEHEKKWHDIILKELKSRRINNAELIFSRKISNKVGLFNPEYQVANDWDMWIRIIAATSEMIYLPKPLSYYRLHDDNTSITSSDRFHKERIQILENFFKKIILF
jgi:hypothetical protein